MLLIHPLKPFLDTPYPANLFMQLFNLIRIFLFMFNFIHAQILSIHLKFLSIQMILQLDQFHIVMTYNLIIMAINLFKLPLKL